jgi:hypothetical protein
MIYIRHYFPAVKIEDLSEEEFAILANDAAWFDSHQVQIKAANSLAALATPTKK